MSKFVQSARPRLEACKAKNENCLMQIINNKSKLTELTRNSSLTLIRSFIPSHFFGVFNVLIFSNETRWSKRARDLLRFRTSFMTRTRNFRRSNFSWSIVLPYFPKSSFNVSLCLYRINWNKKKRSTKNTRYALLHSFPFSLRAFC